MLQQQPANEQQQLQQLINSYRLKLAAWRALDLQLQEVREASAAALEELWVSRQVLAGALELTDDIDDQLADLAERMLTHGEKTGNY